MEKSQKKEINSQPQIETMNTNGSRANMAVSVTIYICLLYNTDQPALTSSFEMETIQSKSIHCGKNIYIYR